MFKFLIVGLMFSGSVMAAQLDRIIAVVNDEVILQSELRDMIQTVRQQMQQREGNIPSTDILRRQVLERLIVQRIQVQRADEMGIRVTDDSLNAALAQIAENNQLTLRQFRDVIEEDGYSYTTFRETIREEMIINQLRKAQVEDTIVVSDREIQNFLATQNLQGNAEESYRLQHILVSLPEAASPEEVQAAETRLAEIKKLLADGGDFAEVATGYSDGQNALEGGDLGWRKKGELPSLFANVVPNLEEGEVSDIIRSGSGFHLVRNAEMKSEETHLVKQTLASHILIKTNEVVTDEEAQRRLEQLRERVINDGDFADLAKANSDDTGSAIEGGSLGWTSPGVMVPEFEERMDALPAGEVSEVFRSRFGWHLIKVFDRREQNMAAEFKRNKAREQIRQRKTDEEMESWIRALRDEAYVEYRDS